MDGENETTLAPMLPLELIFRALSKDPSKVSAGALTKSLVEVRRKSRKRGADVRVSISDEMAKQLKGRSGMRPVFLLVAIPRDMAIELEAERAQAERRKNSRIIRPAGSGGISRR